MPLTGNAPAAFLRYLLFESVDDMLARALSQTAAKKDSETIYYTALQAGNTQDLDVLLDTRSAYTVSEATGG